MTQQNNFKPLSKDTPHQNAGVDCDMEVGPCACGAWHEGLPTTKELDLKAENTRLQKTVSDIHLGLSMLRNDATDGTNYRTLIANAYEELQELRKFKQTYLDRTK